MGLTVSSDGLRVRGGAKRHDLRPVTSGVGEIDPARVQFVGFLNEFPKLRDLEHFLGFFIVAGNQENNLPGSSVDEWVSRLGTQVVNEALGEAVLDLVSGNFIADD